MPYKMDHRLLMHTIFNYQTSDDLNGHFLLYKICAADDLLITIFETKKRLFNEKNVKDKSLLT